MLKIDKEAAGAIYVVTDSKQDHIAVAEAVVAGGAGFMQLREKELCDRDVLKIARSIRSITHGTKSLFIINNRVDIALACQADGVHVGQDDLPAKTVRKMIGPNVILGVSVATVEAAIRAKADGADYVGVGPVFSTMTKLDAGDAIGLDVITQIKNAVDIPIVAIGGISMDNISSVAAAGADSAAVVSAVTGAKDMVEAVQALGERFRI